MKQILYATTNPGKLSEVRKMYKHYGIDIVGPADLGIDIDVDETGETLKENAALKANAYRQIVGKDVIVIADDTGVEIDALGGEPGIKVRRWKGYKMEDEEIINYCLECLNKVPDGKRQAQFHTVLAMSVFGKPLRYFDGLLRGEILEIPQKERESGMPFWPIFYIPELKMTLGEFHSQELSKQAENPTHREIAVISTLPYLRELLK